MRKKILEQKEEELARLTSKLNSKESTQKTSAQKSVDKFNKTMMKTSKMQDDHTIQNSVKHKHFGHLQKYYQGQPVITTQQFLESRHASPSPLEMHNKEWELKNQY